MDEMNINPEIFTLTDEEGNEHEFELMDVMDVDGTTYYALVPYTEDPEAALEEDTELVITSTAGRHLLVNTAAISSKTTKDTAGVNVLTVKKYHKLQSVRPYKEGEFVKPHRYRTKTLPAAGAMLSAEDTGEQLQLTLE